MKLRRVTKRHPCEVCGKQTWCGYSEDGSVAVCMRVESDKPTKNRGWLHVLKETNAPRRQAPPQPDLHSHPLASREHIDAIYSTLVIGHLVLSEEHRAKLESRGFTPDRVRSNCYRSVPTELFGANVARALSQYNLRGVPGFYRERGAWKMVTPGPGILIPVRDSRGRIRGFQVRRDEGSPRYLWFSSASKPEGQSSGAPVHFAHPERIKRQGRVYVTEGALKADVIAARLDCAAIGIPGVTTWPRGFGRNLKKLFPSLSDLRLCFDSDFKTNDNVRRALFGLLAELRGALYSPAVLTWDGQFKGFDDFLTRRAA